MKRKGSCDVLKFNGKVVKVTMTAKKLFGLSYTDVKTGDIGISFCTTSDNATMNNGYTYVHIVLDRIDKYRNPPNFLFIRIPIEGLKLIKSGVCQKVKNEAINHINDFYYKFKYFDNLGYIEAFNNVRNIKIK